MEKNTNLGIKMKIFLSVLLLGLILSTCCQPKQKVNEQPHVFITYKQPINEYSVKVACVSDDTAWNTASFYLNDTLRFTVEGWVDAKLYEMELKHDTVIDYTPKSADYLSNEAPFYFIDVDFDGEDEFLVLIQKSQNMQ